MTARESMMTVLSAIMKTHFDAARFLVHFCM